MNVIDGWIHLYGTKNKKRTNGEKLKKMDVHVPHTKFTQIDVYYVPSDLCCSMVDVHFHQM